MKNLLRLLSVCAVAVSSAYAASTVAVTPSTTAYSAAASSLTITVSFNYDGPLSALDFELTTPAASGAWKVPAVAGTNVPQTIPDPEDLGASGLGFVYTDIPTGAASFTFVLAYPGGMTGKKELTYTAHFTDEAGKVSTVSGRVTLSANSVAAIAPSSTPLRYNARS